MITWRSGEGKRLRDYMLEKGRRSEGKKGDYLITDWRREGRRLHDYRLEKGRRGEGAKGRKEIT